jgi:hypothetical protein
MLKELRATYCFLVDDEKFTELVNDHFTRDARCDFRFRSGGWIRSSRMDTTKCSTSSRTSWESYSMT